MARLVASTVLGAGRRGQEHSPWPGLLPFWWEDALQRSTQRVSVVTQAGCAYREFPSHSREAPTPSPPLRRLEEEARRGD